MRLKDPTDWLEDFTIHLSEEEISSMLSDVEETIVFTGSKPVAAVWLTVAGVLGGSFGGVVVSGAMWRSVWLVLACLLVMPLVWVGMRRLTFGIFGPAIRWQAVLAFFWAFLLGMGAVIGGQIASWWLGYGLSLGAGLLIGLVFGSVNPSFVKNEDAWLLAGLPLGGVSTTFATYVYRNMIADPSTISAAALTGAIAGLILTAPMTALLAALWDVGHGLRHVAVIYLHNDAFARKAIDYLDRAIRSSPNDADLHNLRGIWITGRAPRMTSGRDPPGLYRDELCDGPVLERHIFSGLVDPDPSRSTIQVGAAQGSGIRAQVAGVIWQRSGG